MKKITNATLLFIISISMACGLKQNKPLLKSDAHICSKITILKEYLFISDAFNNLINESFAKTETASSFQQYCDHITNTQNDSLFYAAFYNKFDSTKLLLIFYNLKKLEYFDDIWKEVEYINNSSNTIVKEWLYNEDGCYFQYLRKVDRKYNKKPYYFDGIVLYGGGFMPITFYSGFQKYAYNKYDSNPDFQLVCAVHYFTMIFNILERDGIVSFD